MSTVSVLTRMLPSTSPRKNSGKPPTAAQARKMSGFQGVRLEAVSVAAQAIRNRAGVHGPA